MSASEGKADARGATYRPSCRPTWCLPPWGRLNSCSRVRTRPWRPNNAGERGADLIRASLRRVTDLREGCALRDEKMKVGRSSAHSWSCARYWPHCSSCCEPTMWNDTNVNRPGRSQPDSIAPVARSAQSWIAWAWSGTTGRRPLSPKSSPSPGDRPQPTRPSRANPRSASITRGDNSMRCWRRQSGIRAKSQAGLLQRLPEAVRCRSAENTDFRYSPEDSASCPCPHPWCN